MKKTIVWMMAVLCATMMYAQNYGILVNGSMFYAASFEGTDPYGEGFEQYLAHVQVSSGDYCQLYNATVSAAWVKPLNPASVAGFTYDATNQRYTVSVTGCYDFYIKLKWEADEVYIGPGSDCTAGQDIQGGEPIVPGYPGSAPSNCPDVMLQGFYWDSYQQQKTGSPTEIYGRTKWIDWLNNKAADGVTSLATEAGQWFDLIWLPQMSKSSGGLGYHPSDYSNLESGLGTAPNLNRLIETFHKNGARVVADIVINHADAQNGWCGYSGYNFGTYGRFTPNGSYICSTDEINYTDDPDAAACKGFATGAADDGYGNEANYPSSRDWDHTNTNVQNMFKAYLKWMRNVVKVDGFRYDYCKGYHNSHIKDYNRAAEAYFSVMEMWDGSVDALKSHLNDAGHNTLTFDFATKYQAFNNGIASDTYTALQGPGLLGAGMSRYAVTFIDSHDSFERFNDEPRNENEFCGLGTSMSICRDKVLICNAYMLSMPGVPCVFYPHWVAFKEDIKKMINARYKAGVHSQSEVKDETAGDGFYKATIVGTNGEIRLLLGPNSGYNSTPSGYTLAVKGANYGVYYKMTTPRGDKNTERTDRTQGIEEVTGNGQQVKGEKFIRDGKLYIRCGEQVYDVMGRNCTF